MFFLKFQVLIDCQSIEILKFCTIFGDSAEKHQVSDTDRRKIREPIQIDQFRFDLDHAG